MTANRHARPSVNALISGQDVRSIILATIGSAAWHYDPESDEMDVVLPGAADREGRAVLLDDVDLFVRIDVEDGRPLGLVIPDWSRWLDKPQPSEPFAARDAGDRKVGLADRHEAANIVREKVRQSTEIAALHVPT